MRTKFKAWTVPYLEEHPEVLFTLEQLLSFDKPYYLEIGSGKGQFLIDMAKKFPDKFFVGVERNVTCSGITCKKLVEEETPNAKLMYLDAEVLMKEIPDNSVESIFLNFSDPWPKKRHHKRRLTADSLWQSLLSLQVRLRPLRDRSQAHPSCGCRLSVHHRCLLPMDPQDPQPPY